jgi:AAA domain/UvrD-like helicase C-terminal domain
MTYKQQEQALTLMKLWVDADEQIFVLSGYSGTGKTFVIKQLLEWYRENYTNNSVAVVAPSHKAVKNIQGVLTGLVEAKTISSFLGLTPQIDEKTGLIIFGANTDRNCTINPNDFDLVIVDEYSMINKETVLDLNNQCKKILYLGDPAQLPPVGEDNSIVPTLSAIKYQLTDVVRYSGDLARVAHSWRKDIPVDSGDGTTITLKKISKPIPITTTSDETILEFNKNEWILRYCNSIQGDKNTQLLTFTNRACDKWNSFIRSEIWDTSEPYVIGDKLIAKSPLFRPNSKNRLEIAFNNSSEFATSGCCRLNSLKIAGTAYRYYMVPVMAESGQTTELFILDSASKLIQQAELDRIKNDALASKVNNHRASLWGAWHTLKKTFDDITYAYAITTHKAQGSTYDAVWLDLPDISKCRDIKRITYTALTRSKQAYTYS